MEAKSGAAGRPASRNDSRGGPERHRRRETRCATWPCFPPGLWDSEKIVAAPSLSSGVRRRRLRIRTDDPRGAPPRHPVDDFRAECRAGIHQSRARRHCDPRSLRFRGNGKAFWRSKPSPPAFPCASEFSPLPRNEHREPFQILITGGSRGALPINRAVVDSLDLLLAAKKSAFHRASDW